MSEKGIDTEEAAQVQQTILAESDKAKEAVHNVMNSPQRLTRWKGNRRRKFDEQVATDMQQLSKAIMMIDEAAKKIRAAIDAFVIADDS